MKMRSRWEACWGSFVTPTYELVKGLRKAGPNLTRTQFMRALESIGKEDLDGISLTYSPDNHSGSGYVELTMIGKKRAYVR